MESEGRCFRKWIHGPEVVVRGELADLLAAELDLVGDHVTIMNYWSHRRGLLRRPQVCELDTRTMPDENYLNFVLIFCFQTHM